MRSFELHDGASAKFWEIDQDGSEVTVRWGRVGTTGQTKDSAAEFGSGGECMVEALEAAGPGGG